MADSGDMFRPVVNPLTEGSTDYGIPDFRRQELSAVEGRGLRQESLYPRPHAGGPMRFYSRSRGAT